MEKLESNAALMRSQFYETVAGTRRIDNSFARPADEDLTDEEIRRIDEYWGKYKFAYPDIDYKSFKTFKNRFGSFDVRHCPGSIRTQYFCQHWVNPDYRVALQNKALLPLLFSDVKQPQTVLHQMNGMFSDANYTPLSYEEAVDLLLEESRSDVLILKTSNLGGGRGIFFLDRGATRSDVEDTLTELNKAASTAPQMFLEESAFRAHEFPERSAFVAQKLLEQSDFMKQFNPLSVNTMRITSLIWKGEVRVLAALIRVGREGNQVDNFSQGGSVLGVDLRTGVCNSWALTYEKERVTRLPGGVDLAAQELRVPGFDAALDLVRAMHARIPYSRMISWDIALDRDDQPVLIENNFAGMIQIHEAVTGPLFGELLDELLDTYLLQRFSILFLAGNFLCAEFHDHVEIVDYLGEETEISVPDRLEDKPVTAIQPAAFCRCKLARITVSPTVEKNSVTALRRVKAVVAAPAGAAETDA